jgi:hypothetical protein
MDSESIGGGADSLDMMGDARVQGDGEDDEDKVKEEEGSDAAKPGCGGRRLCV